MSTATESKIVLDKILAELRGGIVSEATAKRIADALERLAKAVEQQNAKVSP